MSKYITFREEDKFGVTGYFILQKVSPHFVARVVNYPVEKSLSNSPVAGYNLYVTFDGTITGNFLPYYSGAIHEIDLLMIEMAAWFLENRIKTNEKKYAKFKITST